MQVERLFEQVKDQRARIELQAGQVKIHGDIFNMCSRNGRGLAAKKTVAAEIRYNPLRSWQC